MNPHNLLRNVPTSPDLLPGTYLCLAGNEGRNEAELTSYFLSWYQNEKLHKNPMCFPMYNPQRLSDSLALSGANDWDYGKTRLWKTEEENDPALAEKEPDPVRRSSTISMKDINSRTTQVTFGYQDGKKVPKLKEPRSLYCVPRSVVPPKWPVGIDTICPPPLITLKHQPPPFTEEFYRQPPGHNPRILEKIDTDRHEGKVVYQQPLMRFPFYTRSRSEQSLEIGQYPSCKYDDDILRFESRFECGNLFRARKVGPYEYELELRWDYYTMKHTQWFYFRVSNTIAGPTYKFTITNLLKSGSLYNEGMRPLFYSEQNAETKNLGWIRIGHNIHYYKNNLRRKDCKGERYHYSLTWQCQFPHTGDVSYFAHCYPYTYSDLQADLLDIANDPVKSQYVKQRILCHSLGGNMVHLLTVTTPSSHLAEAKQKRAVVVTARVHPGETNSSYMMRGFIRYITGSSPDAKVLRDNFVFKIVPMLNPDGVIVGNYRSSLAARDLNRNYKNPIKDAYPSVWSVKAMIRRMLSEREVVLYCDLHGHSRKMNVFMYGCENKDPSLRLRERVFPNMMGRNTSKFKYSACRFKVQKKKEGTGRIVMWQQMGILNSFTMEATFAGYNNIHFNSRDLEDMGYHFCDTLLDYCDPNTSKVEHVLSSLTRIVKAQFAAKMGKNYEDLKDIALEDLDMSDLESSDGGSDSSVSDGPPKLPMLRKTKKKYKTRKERNQIHRQSRKRNLKSAPETTKNDAVKGQENANQQKKTEKHPKSKNDRRCSISSVDSPNSKNTHGIPKHAQERIEERQAKVNKYERDLQTPCTPIRRYTVVFPLDNSGSPATTADVSLFNAGLFHPAHSRASLPNNSSSDRKSLEPSKVAFRFYENNSTEDTDSVQAVLEPTTDGNDGDGPNKDGELSMSVALSGVGNTYSHSFNTLSDDGITEEQYPYSISYRNSNVNSSRRFGTSTFAIRPTKSARKVEKLKQYATTTKSETSADHLTSSDRVISSFGVPRGAHVADPLNYCGVSSSVFSKSKPPHHRPNIPTGSRLKSLTNSRSPEINNTNLMMPEQNQNRSFTSSYLDKLMNKRHSFPNSSSPLIAPVEKSSFHQLQEQSKRHKSLVSISKDPPHRRTDGSTSGR